MRTPDKGSQQIYSERDSQTLRSTPSIFKVTCVFSFCFLITILSCKICSHLKPNAISRTAMVTCIVCMEKVGKPRKFEEAKERFHASPCDR